MSALFQTYMDLAGPDACQTDKGFLALVDAPTGLGKTFQATALQLEHLKSDSRKTVFYATNLRINVKEAYESLLTRIDSDPAIPPENKIELKNSVIMIPAQATSINQLSDDDWCTLFNVIDPNTCRELKKYLDKITMMESVKAAHSANVFTDDLQVIYNSIFNTLRAFFRQQDPQKEQIEAILDRIFPARLINQESTQVIFMTTAKLLYPWHGIKRTFRFSDFLDNSLLILDEFDRQQSEFLAHLISNKSDFDIIGLTRKLYASFDSFAIQGAQELAGVDRCFDKFRETLNNYKKQWRPGLRPFITDQTLLEGQDNQNRIFTLLSDRMSLHAINFKHDNLRSKIDTHTGSHEISPHGELSAIQFVNHGGQLIRSFCNAMLSATLQLKKNLNSLDNNRPYTTENLIEKILNNIGLPELTKSVMSLIGARFSFKEQSDNKTYSFHDSGYEITNIAKYSATDDTAMASTFDLALTSTGLLAHWVLAGAKILGISATATSRTALHNFDLHYLKDVLTAQLLQPSNEQKLAIHQEYRCKRRYLEKRIEIAVTGISNRLEWGGIKALYQEYKNTKYSPSILDTELMQMLGVADKKQLDFALGRVNKLIDSIKRFSEHPVNRYHVCMLNNSYKTQSFSDFISFVGRLFDITIFENINAESFRNEQFQQVLNVLQTTNKKVVVITNYQATGAGLSPSYAIRDKRELIYVGEKGIEPFQFKTDIDSIYIEQPKSLIGSHISEHFTFDEKSVAIKKNIHDALMLHEKGIATASSTKSTLKRFISSSDISWAVNSMISNYKDSEDYQHAIFRFVEQALGRMCRTEWKQAQISIMYDSEEEFVKTLAMDSRDISQLSFEYQALILEAKRHHPALVQDKQNTFYDASASRNFAHIQRLITNVYQHQSKDAIGQYERLRSIMLKQPTLTDPPTGELSRYYIEVESNNGKYEYQNKFSYEKGINEIYINPVDTTGLRQVSESSARLKTLLRNKLVAEYFQQHSYAQAFNDSSYVLAPAMFDIYMGAIGEEAIKALLLHSDYKIESMPEGCIEWFDGCIYFNNRVLLVDVKHWDLNKGCLDLDNTLQKCQQKLFKIKENVPASFKNKVVQALYVNTIYEGHGQITCRKFSPKEEIFTEQANLLEADVIEVPGVIDSESSSSNVPTMIHLLEILNGLKE